MSTEKLAREWVKNRQRSGNKLTAQEKAAAEFILQHTTPLTMAEMEWDDEEHYLAGATFEEDGVVQDVVMFWPHIESPEHLIVTSDSSAPLRRRSLTPNGKRYKLVEVTASDHKPEHPAELATEEDYKNAPLWTVVSVGMWCAIKSPPGWMRVNHIGAFSDGTMSTIFPSMNVIRWGGGE